MAQSKQVQLRSAVAAMLATLTVDGGIHENREFTLGTDHASQVHVNLRSTDPTAPVMYANHPLDWKTELEIVVLARKAGAIEAADVADALWAQIFALVMADQSIGGRADFLEPGVAEIDDDQADTSLCRLTWSVSAQHRTASNTIT
jgi:hypothetical protein